ncbi:uncharacterized protein TrAtP1_002311 [Trichoderma atroviride]|uniref:uncharacterized protein n=1 Tax=Hypocrea atroviridis TaxID=63577 RepID=UPI003326FEC3|nr:hypothetical protein TrAtP1_002311 [Trichoderma atroviride]
MQPSQAQAEESGGGSIEAPATLQSQLSGPLDDGDVELLIADTGHHIQQIHNATQPGSSGPLPTKRRRDQRTETAVAWDVIVTIVGGGSIEAPASQDTLEKRIDGAINQLSILNIVSICAVWLRERICRNSSSGASLPDVKESPWNIPTWEQYGMLASHCRKKAGLGDLRAWLVGYEGEQTVTRHVGPRAKEETGLGGVMGLVGEALSFLDCPSSNPPDDASLAYTAGEHSWNAKKRQCFNTFQSFYCIKEAPMCTTRSQVERYFADALEALANNNEPGYAKLSKMTLPQLKVIDRTSKILIHH